MICTIKKETDVELDITKADFEAYEAVRESGVTNMFMVRTVSELADIPVEKVVAIISNYEKLMKEYPDVRRKE